MQSASSLTLVPRILPDPGKSLQMLSATGKPCYTLTDSVTLGRNPPNSFGYCQTLPTIPLERASSCQTRLGPARPPLTLVHPARHQHTFPYLSDPFRPLELIRPSDTSWPHKTLLYLDASYQALSTPLVQTYPDFSRPFQTPSILVKLHQTSLILARTLQSLSDPIRPC